MKKTEETEAKKSSCDSEECAQCVSSDCEKSPSYNENDPSIIRFMVANANELLKSIVFGTYKFIRSIKLIIFAPWIVSRMQLTQAQILECFKDRCEKNDCPFLMPPTEVLSIAHAVSNKLIKWENDDFYNEVQGRLKEKHGKYIWLKHMIMPFHYLTAGTKNRKKVLNDGNKFNEKFIPEEMKDKETRRKIENDEEKFKEVVEEQTKQIRKSISSFHKMLEGDNLWKPMQQ